MKAVMVSVGYCDLLATCLPRNRRHFSAVHVITSIADAPCVRAITQGSGADLYVTDAFYQGGAEFRKWLAVEECLDAIGRHGPICLLDADVILPSCANWNGAVCGKLFSPLRRMAPWPLDPIPHEVDWARLYPVHRNVNEHAGYCLAFHAEDPALPLPPWLDTAWRHAGGADSFFQARWCPSDKIRPTWECLHLGNAGENWAGRVTPASDGTVPPEAALRRARMAAIWAGRKGKRGDDRFRHERLQ